jgi:hypothetical protein
LTNKAFHGGLPDPAASDLTRGQDATGELAFRVTTLQQIRVLFNTTDQTEEDALQNARNELNSNPTTKPSVSGINWNSLTADDIYVLLGDKSSSFYLHLPPAARARTYDVGDPTQHHDPSLIEEDFDDGSSVTTLRDIFNTATWSSQAWITEANGYLKSHQTVLDAGNKIIEEFDARNARLWEERVTGMDPTGNVTAVQVKLDGETQTRSTANPVDYSAIGQIFGSAIGRAIVGKDGNPFVTLTVGTVAGFVGQKFAQALINGPGAIDLASLDIGNIFNGQGVSLAGAGLGAASSFLTAEIATSIGLNGVGAQMFSAAAGGYLGSVLEQVRQQGFNVLTAVVDWNVALHASEVNIATTIGSLLAHEFVHAESQFGAVGGQLAGAVGSALAYSFSLALGEVLNVFLPGVGAFFGTIIGTIIGDAIAGDPHYPKAYHDVEIIGSDPTHFQNRQFGVDDNGNTAISEAMGEQVTKIANSYLDAVHGAAIYYSGKVMIGYNAGAAPYQYITGWFPDGLNGPAAHFSTASDAIQEGVRELLQNTEVIGGDLLIKRAHQAFINGVHAAPTEIAPDFTDLASLGGDLRTAQDYEQYLSANVILIGGAAKDTLTGGDGWDFVDGGAGNDALTGGDLVMKRAYQAVIYPPRIDRNRGVNARRPVRSSGWRCVRRATVSMPCIQKAA